VALTKPKFTGLPIIEISSCASCNHCGVSVTCPNCRRAYKPKNQYTLKDLEKAVYLATSRDENWKYTFEEILEQVSTISIIEVDNQFNILSYE